MRLGKPWTENGVTELPIGYYEKFWKRKQKVICREITECAISTAICYKDMTVQLCCCVR